MFGLFGTFGKSGKFRVPITITSPVDTTITIANGNSAVSTGAIVIDSVAAGSGIVIINGIWRLS